MARPTAWAPTSRPPRRIAGEASRPAARSTALAVHRAALWAILASDFIAGWGVQWDIQWHIRIGRDSFWIAPHVITYAGVSGMVLVSFGVVAWDTWRRRGAHPGADEVTVLGLTSTPGFQLAAWGIALTVLAAPIDDLWHRLFGIDVTLWSPPHMLGLLGAMVATAACMLVAREVHPPRSAAAMAALIVGGALLLGKFATAAQPAFRIAYLHGGVGFHLYAMLGAFMFPLAHLTAVRLTGWRWAPLWVLLVAVTSGQIGAEIARVGFRVLQPVSVIEEEILKDPTSPIAVAHAIAQKNAHPPGSRSPRFPLASLLSVLVMIAFDPRGRPTLSVVAYGLALLATMSWALAGTPAFAPSVPGIAETLVAVASTIIVALAGGAGARWLAHLLAGPTPLPSPAPR